MLQYPLLPLLDHPENYFVTISISHTVMDFSVKQGRGQTPSHSPGKIEIDSELVILFIMSPPQFLI